MHRNTSKRFPILIKRLPRNISQEDIRECLSPFGEILRIASSHISFRAVVMFKEKEGAEEAMKFLNGKDKFLGLKNVTAEWALEGRLFHKSEKDHENIQRKKNGEEKQILDALRTSWLNHTKNETSPCLSFDYIQTCFETVPCEMADLSVYLNQD